MKDSLNKEYRVYLTDVTQLQDDTNLHFGYLEIESWNLYKEGRLN